MRPPTRRSQSACNLVLFLIQIATHSTCAGQLFSSHISVNTPARSYSHGVGHPVGQPRRTYQRMYSSGSSWRSGPPKSRLRTKPSVTVPGPTVRSTNNGYARVRPSIPFTNEDIRHQNALSVSPWQHNGFMEVPIPVLPPSPYKVDSPDPESLWPEGLFLPPRFLHASQFQHHRRADASSPEQSTASTDPLDSYLLEGSEAIAAVEKARQHGLLYFHDVPHIESLLANQELRILNRLQPHRLGSIRHSWPYNRT